MFACIAVIANLCMLLSSSSAGDSIQVDVYPIHKIAPLHHFWESTGLCPPLPHKDASQFLLSDDMLQNLLLVASVPHDGIKQIRIHWLLEMITHDHDSYNFSKLDQLIAFMYKNQLQPGFEIMGNPSNIFSDFNNMTQVFELQKLVTTLADRYINTYGLEYVSKWNFETWNEPDHKDFDNISMSVEGFLKYYDACSEGLMKVDPKLVYGGPGGSCRKPAFSRRCFALMEHCSNGTNYITGKIGSRINYISFHKKGSGTSKLILDEELKTIAQIQSDYPKLKATPIYNDEADPLVGWSKPEWWRADATYAAIIAKIIGQHQNQIIAKGRSHINYALLSNDNAFLSYSPHFFTQRTLNARFQVNNTNPKYVHLIRKPALIVMGLLSKLGTVQINMTMSKTTDAINGISSLCANDECEALELSSLFYNSVDTEPLTGGTTLKLWYHNLTEATFHYGNYKKVPALDLKIVTCVIDNIRTNPHGVWKSIGSPLFPTAAQFGKLHDAEGPFCSEPVAVELDKQGAFQTHLYLPLPGVALQQICSKPATFSGKPSNLHLHAITHGQVLIVWDDYEITTKCIRTYIVQYSSVFQPYNFITINASKIVFTSFVYITSASISGVYRVKAVDFWGRSSAFSKPVTFRNSRH